MKVLLLVLAGLGLIFTGNTYAVFAGCCIAMGGVVTFTVASLVKENTANVKGDLARLCSQYGGLIINRKPEIEESVPAGIGDIIQFKRANREIYFTVPRFHGSAATGGTGGGLHVLVNTPLVVNQQLDLRVGRKTLIRLGDRYAGSDCVFYAAETLRMNGRNILVAGKDKEMFTTVLRHDRQLATAVETISFDMGYDEIRIGTGGEKILKLGKRYTRNDTQSERVIALFDAIVKIMDKLDTEEMAAKTKPHPPEKKKTKGVSFTCIAIIAAVIAVFIYAMRRIS